MEHATELLWRELRDRLRTFIARRVSNPADVEDLLQEVFLRIHQHLSTVREVERLTPWIFQLTRNAIIDYYRAAPRRHEIPTDVSLNSALAGEEHPAVSPPNGEDEETRNAELALCLTPLIERLPEHYREAIQLVEIEGVPQRELSTRLAVSLSGAKSRVQRGREKLKDLLLRCCQVALDKRGNVVDYQQEAGSAGCQSATSTATASQGQVNPSACSCMPPKEGHHEHSTV